MQYIVYTKVKLFFTAFSVLQRANRKDLMRLRAALTAISFLWLTATFAAPTYYTMSTNPGSFVPSVVNQEQNGVLGTAYDPICDNTIAIIYQQDGGVTVIGDYLAGSDAAPPACPYGRGHVNVPSEVLDTGAVVGTSHSVTGGPYTAWHWNDADGFSTITTRSEGPIEVNPAGVIVGTTNSPYGQCSRDGGAEKSSGVVYHPQAWSYYPFPLDELVSNLPEGTCIFSAIAVNDSGQILATAIGNQPGGAGSIPYEVVLTPAPTYIMTTDVSQFDVSSLSHGTGDTLGTFLDGETCENTLAVINHQDGTTTVIGDYFAGQGGFAECPSGQLHYNRPMAINSDGSVTGVSAINEESHSEGAYASWKWTATAGFETVWPSGLATSPVAIDDYGNVVGSAKGLPGHIACSEYGYNYFGAYIARPMREVESLNLRIANRPSQTCIMAATAINNRGQILAKAIVGVGAGWDAEPAIDVVLIPSPDVDGDGVGGPVDNCTLRPNADQRDSNGDGYGNVCDGDLDDSGGLVNIADLARFRVAFGSDDADADFNGSGSVNAADLALFRLMFGSVAGPSGLTE